MYDYFESSALLNPQNEISISLFSVYPTDRCGMVVKHAIYQTLNETIELPHITTAQAQAQAQKGDLSYDDSASN